MSLDFTGYSIPGNTQGALERYVEHKLAPGGFLEAVLTNKLFEAVGRADFQNKEALADICKFIYNRCPATCHGSEERFKAWLES